MNCKKIQEIIMTDYHDNEAPESVQRQIRAHLATCNDCRAFERAVLQNTDMLFKDIGPVQPPESVWNGIQKAINEERSLEALSCDAPPFHERVWYFFRNSFIIKRPAYVFATAFTVILVAVVFWGSPLRRQMLVKDYLSQKSAFMVALNNAPNGDMDKVSNFNTAIEQYLF